MNLQVPDSTGFSAEELRLELACALFARGRVSAITGSEMAGVDLFAFQRSLAERGISRVTGDDFEDDLTTMQALAR